MPIKGEKKKKTTRYKQCSFHKLSKNHVLSCICLEIKIRRKSASHPLSAFILPYTKNTGLENAEMTICFPLDSPKMFWWSRRRSSCQPTGVNIIGGTISLSRFESLAAWVSAASGSRKSYRGDILNDEMFHKIQTAVKWRCRQQKGKIHLELLKSHKKKKKKTSSQ